MTNDSDSELIEAYLDDALSCDQVEQLDRRLAREADLADLLGTMRTERALRSLAWMAQEPADDAANVLASRIVAAVRRRRRARAWARASRLAGAVAACILCGFIAGWIGRGRAEGPAPGAAQSRLAAGPLTHAAMSIDPSGAYQVALTDDGGSVIAVQKFARYEEARQFADDLAAYEGRRRAVQQGRAVFISDQF